MGITVFSPAPVPANEYQRREAVLSSGLLSLRDDPALTALAHEARAALSADWAAVVLVLDDWQHVVASTEGMLGRHRRSTCLSGYVLVQPATPFLLLDAPSDPQFRGNPFVEDGLIGFYAGAAIIDRDGFPIGVLCATDRTPRARFDEREQAVLAALADRVIPLGAAAQAMSLPEHGALATGLRGS